MCGDGVAVLERRPPASGPLGEERSVKCHDAIGESDGECARRGVDRFHLPALAVADVETATVVLDDDVIAGREARSADEKLVAAVPTVSTHDGPRSAVELADVSAVVGDHEAPVYVVGCVPI